jgi:tRNA threonylcarbamoyladenosine biosynthesis protein TsaE
MNQDFEPDQQTGNEMNESRRFSQAALEALLAGGSIVTRSAEETFQLGYSIGSILTSPAIFLLSGDLGAGKTLFTKGLASGLGIDPTDVTSPSFTLVNIHEGRVRLYHVDLYRLDQVSSLDLGLEEIFADESAVTVIEWAERLRHLPTSAITVDLVYLSDTERQISIQTIG